MMLSDDEQEKSSENYPLREDRKFTPDQIEEIKRYKARLQYSLEKKHAVARSMEAGFWAITSYSLARFLILSSGSSGLPLAYALTFFINQIVNRDLLDFSFSFKEGGFEVLGIQKLIRFGASTIVTAVVLWSSVGNFVQMISSSESTFTQMEHQLDEFEKLPSDERDKILIILALIGVSGLYVVLDRKR